MIAEFIRHYTAHEPLENVRGLLTLFETIADDRDRLAFQNRVLLHEIDLLAQKFAVLNREYGITGDRPQDKKHTTQPSTAATPLELEF